jgi:uncharacterized membrane protein
MTLAALNILRHDAFASGLDLGNMDQTVWNTLHGRWFSLTTEGGTVSRFFHHAEHPRISSSRSRGDSHLSYCSSDSQE